MLSLECKVSDLSKHVGRPLGIREGPKLTPQPHFGTFPEGVDHFSRGIETPTPNPPSIFTLRSRELF